MSEDMSAMSGTGKYRLTTNLVITDKYIDANSTYGGSYFTPDFNGTLDGNGHTITFNADTSGQTYFNGAFRFVYGVIKNTNFVVNLTTPHSSQSVSRGVLTYRLYGVVENCIINLQAVKYGNGYGYSSTFGELGADAVINNVVINTRKIYLAGGAIAKIVQPTSKVSNVVVLSNQVGYATDMWLAPLPADGKCDITNFYFYSTGSDVASFDKAINAGSPSYNLKLDEEKYNAEGAPNNITWNTSNCSTANIEVLYNMSANVAIADIVGFAVEAYDADIITKTGASTLVCLRFVEA